MFHRFKKKPDWPKRDPNNPSVLILKQTRPNECGGTDSTLDESAPKTIQSTSLILFDVTSALSMVLREPDANGEPFRCVSAFAAPTERGSFLFLETVQYPGWEDENRKCWGIVTENLSLPLAQLVRECGFSKQNGYHSTTHGLPENFGGSVLIRYASGEKISFSNNQAPLFSRETAMKIKRFFETAMQGERIRLPSVSKLQQIRFDERRRDGGFTHAKLALLPDGTGLNAKEQRFGDGQIYKSETPVDRETITQIKRVIDACGLLAWDLLPESKYRFDHEKSLTFVFAPDCEITITNDRLVPQQIRNGFFNIELELTTRH